MQERVDRTAPARLARSLARRAEDAPRALRELHERGAARVAEARSARSVADDDRASLDGVDRHVNEPLPAVFAPVGRRGPEADEDDVLPLFQDARLASHQDRLDGNVRDRLLEG